MMADLVQLVDMTRAEMDGLEGFVLVDEQGRHCLELVERQEPCEACPSEVELVETEDGITVAEQPAYLIKGIGGTSPLCQQHLAYQPFHVGFKAVQRGRA